MLSIQKVLVSCDHGLHESTTQWRGRRVHVYVAYVTTENALLLRFDNKTGKLMLPFESLSPGNLLLGSPMRVAARSFDMPPGEVLSKRQNDRAKILGMQQDSDGGLDILMSVGVVKLTALEALYVSGYEDLMQKVTDLNAPVYMAAKSIGWQGPDQELLAA